MASSTFEIRESESDSEKIIDFDIDACEENGILMSHSDSEAPKDHTYNKEPDIVQDEESKATNSSDDPAVSELKKSPAKPKAKATKSKKKTKKAAAKDLSKQEPTKKAVSSPKKGRPKKDSESSAMETENKDDNLENESIEQSSADEPQKPTKVSQRGRKRKVEVKDVEIERKEKENVLEEVQNITENSTIKESSEESTTEEPPRKKSTRLQPKKEVKTPKNVKAKAKVPKKVSIPVKPTKEGKKSEKINTSTGKVPKKKISLNDDGVDRSNLPKGWLRKTVVRQSGKSAGQIDVYIYSPDGLKFRSRPDVAAYLARTKSSLKLDAFDFSKKKTNMSKPAKAKSSSVETPKKKPVPVKKTSVVKKKVNPAPRKATKLQVKFGRPKNKTPLKKVTKVVKKGKSSAIKSKTTKKNSK